MGCATVIVQDRFHDVFGARRGSSRPVPNDPVSLACRALSAEDLDNCLTLGLSSDERDLLSAAKIDHELLGLLKPSAFFSLAVKAELMSMPMPVFSDEGTVPDKAYWSSLGARLRTCAHACETRDAATLADVGARTLGMHSAEGSIVLSKLLDQVVSRNARTLEENTALLNAYQEGIRRVGQTHPEVYDSAARGAIAEDLRAHGFNTQSLLDMMLNIQPPR